MNGTRNEGLVGKDYDIMRTIRKTVIEGKDKKWVATREACGRIGA